MGNLLMRRRMMMEEQAPSFGGLMLAPAPLYYNGSTFVIKGNYWNQDSYNGKSGKESGSYYFNFVELGSYFDSRGGSFSTSSGDIDNNGYKVTYGGYNDWRLPISDELSMLTTGGIRKGSTVNGVSGCKYAVIRLTGVTHANSSSPYGILFAPDNVNISASKTLNWNSTSYTSGVTETQLQEYLNYGCIFWPASGNYYTLQSRFYNGGAECYHWSSSQHSSDTSKAYSLRVNSYTVNPTSDEPKTTSRFPVFLVRKGHAIIPEPIYVLNNYTCNGTSSTAINTGLRLFNATDFPNGFRFVFSGKATRNSTSNCWSWFGCMDETGSPWPGFVVRQYGTESTLDCGINLTSSVKANPRPSCSSGTSVSVTFTYDRTTFTYDCNGLSGTLAGVTTHNFPLCIGGTLQTETTWFSDRYGYCQIDSLKVYKL